MAAVLEYCPPHQAPSCPARLGLPGVGAEEEESPGCWGEGLSTLLFLVPGAALVHHSGTAPCKNTLAVTQANREPRASPSEVSGPEAVQTHRSSLLLHPLSSMNLLYRTRSAPAHAGPFPWVLTRKVGLCALGVLSKGSD